jgi:hypothetical protein
MCGLMCNSVQVAGLPNKTPAYGGLGIIPDCGSLDEVLLNGSVTLRRSQLTSLGATATPPVETGHPIL